LSWFEVLSYVFVNKRNTFQDCVLIDPGTRLAFITSNQQDGPAEKAGKNVDQTPEEAGKKKSKKPAMR
jgi:hypothetical protein